MKVWVGDLDKKYKITIVEIIFTGLSIYHTDIYNSYQIYNAQFEPDVQHNTPTKAGN